VVVPNTSCNMGEASIVVLPLQPAALHHTVDTPSKSSHTPSAHW
jgi:hypothetical protein